MGNILTIVLIIFLACMVLALVAGAIILIVSGIVLNVKRKKNAQNQQK